MAMIKKVIIVEGISDKKRVKEALNEDFYDVAQINSVTLLGVRESEYGERFAPLKQEEKVVYHIENR